MAPPQTPQGFRVADDAELTRDVWWRRAAVKVPHVQIRVGVRADREPENIAENDCGMAGNGGRGGWLRLPTMGATHAGPARTVNVTPAPVRVIGELRGQEGAVQRLEVGVFSKVELLGAIVQLEAGRRSKVLV